MLTQQQEAGRISAKLGVKQQHLGQKKKLGSN